jgi:hypothetical protein
MYRLDQPANPSAAQQPIACVDVNDTNSTIS